MFVRFSFLLVEAMNTFFSLACQNEIGQTFDYGYFVSCVYHWNTPHIYYHHIIMLVVRYALLSSKQYHILELP